MPPTKQKPCCARYAGKVVGAKADLARVAEQAARADSKGQSMGHWKLRIANAKVAIENAEKFLVEHEAEHATD